MPAINQLGALQVFLDDGAATGVTVNKINRTGAAAQRLDAHGAAAGEQIKHYPPVVRQRFQNLKDHAAEHIRGRTSGRSLRDFKMVSFGAARNYPHPFSIPASAFTRTIL